MSNLKENMSVYRGLPRGVYFLFFANVINEMGGFIMPLMTLILTVKIGMPDSQAGLFASLAMLVRAPFLLLGGKLADRFGGKRVVLLFNAAGALVYLFCGMRKPDLFVAFLILAASAFFAAAQPALNAVAAQISPRSRIGSVYSLMYLGLNLGFAIGPTLAGFLFNSYLNTLFWLDGLSTLLATALVLFGVHTKGEAEPTYPEQTETASETSAETPFLVFLRRTPVLAAFNAVMLLFYFCVSQWSFLLPLQMVRLFPESGATKFSFLFSTNAVAAIVLTALLTVPMQKLRPVGAVFLGGIFYAASFLLFAFSREIGFFFASMVVLTAGEVFVVVNSNSCIALYTPQSHMGRATSLLFTMKTAGQALGPAVMGAVLAETGFANAWLIVFAVMLFAACSLIFVRRLERTR